MPVVENTSAICWPGFTALHDKTDQEMNIMGICMYMYERTRRKGKRITFIITIFIFIRYHVIVEIDNQILTKKNSIDYILFSSFVEKVN